MEANNPSAEDKTLQIRNKMPAGVRIADPRPNFALWRAFCTLNAFSAPGKLQSHQMACINLLVGNVIVDRSEKQPSMPAGQILWQRMPVANHARAISTVLHLFNAKTDGVDMKMPLKAARRILCGLLEVLTAAWPACL